MLVSLLVLLAIGSWLNERFERLAVFELLLTLVMLSSIRRLSARPRQALIGVLLALPTIACLWLRKLIPVVGLTEVALGLLLLFLLYTAVTVLLHIFRAKRITLDIISEAFSVYLLMGFAWGSIYALIYLQEPGAFHLPEGTGPTVGPGITWDVPLDVLIYYSFVTLTTVGYGDVSPIATSARSMAVLEVVLGQFYLAVLIARLVGLHTSDTPKHTEVRPNQRLGQRRGALPRRWSWLSESGTAIWRRRGDSPSRRATSGSHQRGSPRRSSAPGLPLRDSTSAQADASPAHADPTSDLRGGQRPPRNQGSCSPASRTVEAKSVDGHRSA